MQVINKLDTDFTRQLIFCLSISYSVSIIILLVVSIVLLLIHIKFLLIRLISTLAAILDSDEFINASINYKSCSNNIYNLSPLHRLRINLLCLSREIQDSENSNIISEEIISYESRILTKDVIQKIKGYKFQQFYDSITNKFVYMYINTDLDNTFDSCKFEHAINYIDIFYNRFGKINRKINCAILNRLNCEFMYNQVNTNISERIYLFYLLCLQNKYALYTISNKKHIDLEISLLYKFIKTNIL